MSCRYINTLKADFGRKISAEEANEQFDAIEEAMGCLELLREDAQSQQNSIYNYGSVSTTTVLVPAYGNMQKITIEADVDFSFANPQEADPRVIHLLVAGDGTNTFSFPYGTVWTTGSHAASGSEGGAKPWDSGQLGGDYGAMVICVHDSISWTYLVFARNGIDFTATADFADIYRWE